MCDVSIMTCGVWRVTCDVLHDQVIVLSVGRVLEQGKPSHNVALLHSAAVACDMLPNNTAVTCDMLSVTAVTCAMMPLVT